MEGMVRFLVRLSRGAWVTVLFACLFAGSGAEAQSPTAEQMQIFRNLPPDQQQAILEAMASGSSGSSSGVLRDKDLKSPETVKPRDAYADDENRDIYDQSTTDLFSRDKLGSTMREREPRIRGNDTVLLDLAIEQPGSTVPSIPGGTTGTTTYGTTGTATYKEQTRRLDRVSDKPRTAEETARLEEMRERLMRGNPYKLDENGLLRLPGVAPIALSGLTEKQATERLNLDPALREFEVALKLLPLQARHGGAQTVRIRLVCRHTVDLCSSDGCSVNC